MFQRSVLLLALFLASCASAPSGDQPDPDMLTELDGTYRGRYWVTHQEGSSEQRRVDGPVWMRFEQGGYQIEGERLLLPPAGGGEYRIEGRVLILEDTMVHTADFDWSLILKGRFDIDPGGEGHLRLTQRDLDHGRYHELDLSYEGPSSSTR